jgi:diguanylate cyclase (GGDEF)-like protein
MTTSSEYPTPHGAAGPDAGHDAQFAHLVQVLQRGRTAKPERRHDRAEPVSPTPLAGSSSALLDQAERLARASHLNAAIELCQGLEERLLQERDPRNMGRREYVLLLSHQYAGRQKEAAIAGYKALEWFRMCDDTSLLVRATALQATVAARIGDGPGAIELIQRAGALAERPDCTPRDRCIFWLNSGDLQETLGNHEAALEASTRGLAGARELGEESLEWVCRANIATARLKLVQARLASADELVAELDALRAFIGELVASGRDHLVARLAADGANALIGLDRLMEAQALLREGTQAADRIGALPEKGPLEIVFARVCRLRGERRSAQAHIAAALELLALTDQQDALAQAHLENCLLQEMQGKWRSALDSHRKYVEIWLALSRAQADARLEASHIRLELERSRGEADALKREKASLEGRLRDANEEATDLKRLAMEDPLTGLANRRRFFEAAASLRGQDQQTMAVLMIDLDHFKQVNDTFSHATGDLVLRELAMLMCRHSRPADVAARIGGEEFAMLYVGGIALAQALAVAERLRAAIAEHDWESLVPGLRVTASVGLTPFHGDETIDVALARADVALYASKTDGRNRVTQRDR